MFYLDNKRKSENLIKNVTLCERLQEDHCKYIKWLESTKLFTNEIILKLLSNLEIVSMEISSNFFQNYLYDVSTKLQKISFNIAISKLKKLLTNDKNESLFKNLQDVTDYLLLSLRMSEKFSEAIGVLDELNNFLKEFNMDVKYMELIVLNWFKIKLDGSKLQSKDESRKKHYENKIKYKTITRLVKSIKKDLHIDYLFEELRFIKYFNANSPSNQMYDEILCIINELIALIDPKIGNSSRILSDMTNKSKDSSTDANKNSSSHLNINECRLYIEIAHFNWFKHLCTKNEYFKSSNFINISIDECLEKADELLKSHKCSPNKCRCVDYLTMKFLKALYVFLNKYALQREKMCSSLKNTTQSSNKYLLCTELYLNGVENVNKQSDFLKQLEDVYEILKEINPDSVDIFDIKFLSLKNQLFASIDLLTNLFGFFSSPLRKIDCLNLKLKFLSKGLIITYLITQIDLSEFTKQPSASCAGISTNLTSSSDTFLTMIANTILQLMKSYLNLHQFKQLNNLNTFLTQKTIDQCVSDGDYNVQDPTLIEKNKIFANAKKKEFILTYYLMVSHYLILKKNFIDAVHIIQNRVVKSDVICGQLNASHYEAKYYFKYLLFILSTVNCRFLYKTKQNI